MALRESDLLLDAINIHPSLAAAETFLTDYQSKVQQLTLVTPNGQEQFASNPVVVSSRVEAMRRWFFKESMGIRGTQLFPPAVCSEILAKHILEEVLIDLGVPQIGVFYTPTDLDQTLVVNGVRHRGGDLLVGQKFRDWDGQEGCIPFLMIDVTTDTLENGDRNDKKKPGINRRIDVGTVVLSIQDLPIGQNGLPQFMDQALRPIVLGDKRSVGTTSGDLVHDVAQKIDYGCRRLGLEILGDQDELDARTYVADEVLDKLAYMVEVFGVNRVGMFVE